MTVNDIITEFGAYYLRSGQNANRIKQLLLQPSVTPSYMTPIKTDDTIFQMAKSSISSVVQGFQKAWTPKGETKFTPNKIESFHLKVDVEEYPDDLEATWLGFLASNSVNRKEWPFVKWLIEVHIIPKIKEDMELYEYGLGVHEEPTAGTPNAVGKNLNGLKKLIQVGVDNTQNPMNHVSDIGALDADTIFDQVEAFVDKISDVYQTKKMNVFVPYKFMRAYLRDKRSQGFYNLTGDKQIDNSIDFTPQQVVGLPSLNGETFMFATPKENMFHITKKSANMTNFKIEESKRQVFIMSDWWEGIGFGINDAVWTTLPKTT
ncbi:hypothetical protein ACT29H_09355 [Thermophagus sp. OGC60D27]|uniref:hypothetical protein n=1 Tax=Thermophagus sp. OGC60D27 TaxID=3458415 RepID=UPI00403816F6